jgi:hypothetical protein
MHFCADELAASISILDKVPIIYYQLKYWVVTQSTMNYLFRSFCYAFVCFILLGIDEPEITHWLGASFLIPLSIMNLYDWFQYKGE